MVNTWTSDAFVCGFSTDGEPLRPVPGRLVRYKNDASSLALVLGVSPDQNTVDIAWIRRPRAVRLRA